MNNKLQNKIKKICQEVETVIMSKAIPLVAINGREIIGEIISLAIALLYVFFPHKF
jgi:hypothetical protein